MNDSLGAFNLILLAMPGLALIVAARTLFRPRQGQRPQMQQLLRMVGILLILLALCGAAVGVFGLLALLGLPVIAIVGLMIVDRYRQGEHRSLLFTLAAGARRGVPLNESALAFADENGGDTAARAAALADGIGRGLSVRESARSARLKMSTATKLSLRLGESLGDLGNILLRSLDDSTELDTALRSMAAQFLYLVALITVGLYIVVYLMLRIVPVFERMFEDFGIKLPRITAVLVGMSQAMGDIGWFFLGIIPLISLAVLFVGALLFIGWVPANIPLLNLLTRKYDNSLVLRGLARCVQRRLNLSDAIGVLSHEFPRWTTAKRLRNAWLGVQEGIDWRLAMQRSGLLTPAEAAVLAAAERNGNLVWALDELADGSLRRYILSLQIRYQVAFPLVVFGLGVCVGYIVIALMLPLAALIQGLA